MYVDEQASPEIPAPPVSVCFSRYVNDNVASVEYESLSPLNLRHALQLVEIAKQPRIENKSELLSDAAAAFRTLWQ